MTSMEISSPGVLCPSIDEHQADLGTVKARLDALKERNGQLEFLKKKSQQRCDTQDQQRLDLKHDLQDQVDRAKFIRIASVPNPSPIGQYSGTLKCPPPAEWYQRQISLVRNNTQTLLIKEDDPTSTVGAPNRTAEWKEERQRLIPHNFSPYAGHTQSSVRGLSDGVLLGLRSKGHSGSNRLPGPIPRVLPKNKYQFQEVTNSYLSRSGAFDVGRSRAYVSAITKSASSPSF
eukprot:TRINITY_DN44369_c0_g1_i1.p1 TRINITY_DN44369_c0_g1~~TRINITY_DN44369_c0_g1_i1.p1  ORF type:complete len:232 (+),score=31.61 TRINITY_DN44369_c0_g1_i1:211-906(+)